MGKIFEFDDHLKPATLDDFLKQALVFKKRFNCLRTHGRVNNVGDIIRPIISSIIIDDGAIESGVFLCAIHVSNLLTEAAVNTPEKWRFSDYLENYAKPGAVNEIMAGANLCFLYCVFYCRSLQEHQAFKRFYFKVGPSLYYQAYTEEEKTIGYHMSGHYEYMVNVAVRGVEKIIIDSNSN